MLGPTILTVITRFLLIISPLVPAQQRSHPEHHSGCFNHLQKLRFLCAYDGRRLHAERRNEQRPVEHDRSHRSFGFVPKQMAASVRSAEHSPGGSTFKTSEVTQFGQSTATEGRMAAKEARYLFRYVILIFFFCLCFLLCWV